MGLFNLAVYWKSKYRNLASKDPWYILTNLPTLKQALAIYRCRWSIEQLFKDYKTGGYHLEDTRVNETQFLALVLLMVIATVWRGCKGKGYGDWDRDLCRTYPSAPRQAPTPK